MKLSIFLNAKESHALANLSDFFGNLLSRTYKNSYSKDMADRLHNVTGEYEMVLSVPAGYLPEVGKFVTIAYRGPIERCIEGAKSFISAARMLKTNFPKDFRKVASHYIHGVELSEKETHHVSNICEYSSNWEHCA